MDVHKQLFEQFISHKKQKPNEPFDPQITVNTELLEDVTQKQMDQVKVVSDQQLDQVQAYFDGASEYKIQKGDIARRIRKHQSLTLEEKEFMEKDDFLRQLQKDEGEKQTESIAKSGIQVLVNHNWQVVPAAKLVALPNPVAGLPVVNAQPFDELNSKSTFSFSTFKKTTLKTIQNSVEPTVYDFSVKNKGSYRLQLDTEKAERYKIFTQNKKQITLKTGDGAASEIRPITLPEEPMNEIPFPSEGDVIFVFGPSGSGKTHMLTNLMKQMKKGSFEVTVIYGRIINEKGGYKIEQYTKQLENFAANRFEQAFRQDQDDPLEQFIKPTPNNLESSRGAYVFKKDGITIVDMPGVESPKDIMKQFLNKDERPNIDTHFNNLFTDSDSIMPHLLTPADFSDDKLKHGGKSLQYIFGTNKKIEYIQRLVEEGRYIRMLFGDVIRRCRQNMTSVPDKDTIIKVRLSNENTLDFCEPHNIGSLDSGHYMFKVEDCNEDVSHETGFTQKSSFFDPYNEYQGNKVVYLVIPEYVESDHKLASIQGIYTDLFQNVFGTSSPGAPAGGA